MKRYLSLICLGLSANFCRAPAAPLPADTNFFPIMAWNGAPKDLAVLRKMHDCGLTVAGFAAPDALDACQKAGLKAIVSDVRVSDYDWAKVDAAKARKNVASLVAKVNRHPAVYGYSLRDEPSADLFPGLGIVAGLIRELAPGKMPYINLFPDYATPGQLGTPTYADYLESFIATCKPGIISYDNYSLMDDGSVRDNYWSNLESVRAACKKHGLEFWNIVLSVAHFSYRELNAADFRFQVYTTLAYGGRGISYFVYFTPPTGNYRMAPIDQFGNQTPTWYYMQHANLQVLKLAPTLLQLTSDAVYHFGHPPAGASGPPPNSLLTGAGGDVFMAGDFTRRDGSRYVMIVNKDLAKSHPCSPQYRSAPKRVLHVSAYTGAAAPFEGEDVWLPPGGGTLLKLEH
ncbi:MAG TPA: hypothetical protein VMU04_21095 [Candidatus Acidoferrum sp.]|nr:hypothetical protein [Candidatus Acidoferrum sp.]